MSTKKERLYDIVDGPDENVLFEACKHACGKNVKFAEGFVVAIGYTMPKDHPGCAYIPMAITNIRIVGIEHEDGSGKSFNLHGYCKADLNSLGGTNVVYKSYKFEAYYSSKNCKGYIILR